MDKVWPESVANNLLVSWEGWRLEKEGFGSRVECGIPFNVPCSLCCMSRMVCTCLASLTPHHTLLHADLTALPASPPPGAAPLQRAAREGAQARAGAAHAAQVGIFISYLFKLGHPPARKRGLALLMQRRWASLTCVADLGVRLPWAPCLQPARLPRVDLPACLLAKRCAW